MFRLPHLNRRLANLTENKETPSKCDNRFTQWINDKKCICLLHLLLQKFHLLAGNKQKQQGLPWKILKIIEFLYFGPWASLQIFRAPGA